ncbi:MAG: glutamine amidotransferase [Veillonella sp.]|uniref:glutamine amidotransferase n=1 Tax=Veillonella sp. TaxID=1926307 RepID=UPI001B43C03B|nr:glutamine amidotransferase [Veillonella sp.]MBK7921352.1 glutamine amidotransferase [Veillonella sp.]MBP8617354.1 glutamine amidotransferase [Veillonella sp.]
MSRTAYIIRHINFEDFGILEPVLINLGYIVTYLDAPLLDFSAYDPTSPDLLVACGAPIGAYDESTYPFLITEMDFIKARLDSKKPILGICLGAQLMSRILGGSVAPMTHGKKEIGFSTLTLTSAGESSPLQFLSNVPVLHWHGDEFQIPPTSTRLAETDLCHNQAYAIGNNVLGLQFHMEADPNKIESWLVGHASELNSAGIDVCQIRADAKKYGDALTEAATKTFHAWLAQLDA